MKIELIFNGLGYQNICQANILIYDNQHRLIYDGQTYNGRLKINLKKNNIYRIIANNKDEIIDTYIYINNNIYCFNFKRSFINKFITFILKDYFYNLPIERGELIIWQK